MYLWGEQRTHTNTQIPGNINFSVSYIQSRHLNLTDNNLEESARGATFTQTLLVNIHKLAEKVCFHRLDCDLNKINIFEKEDMQTDQHQQNEDKTHTNDHESCTIVKVGTNTFESHDQVTWSSHMHTLTYIDLALHR